jgi:hypothetical protein
MLTLRWMPLMRRSSFCAAAFLLAAGFAIAQTAPSADQSSSSGESSSQAGIAQLAALALPGVPAPGSPASAASGSGGGQYGNGGGYGGGGGKHAFLHNYTFEAGAGFGAPIGNDTNQYGVVTQSNGSPEGVPVITFGGNFTLGGGLRLNNRVSVLGEYQFMDNKLPGALIADVNSATGGADDISAGDTHINSITGSPVVDLFPKWTNGINLVGGFGWYHKSTNFQAPEPVISYYGEYYENVTVTSFSSSQWGGNIGLGFYHKLGGGMYGNDTSHTELFAEARYTFIHTPPPTAANGLGTTELIPVTFGVRF